MACDAARRMPAQARRVGRRGELDALVERLPAPPREAPDRAAVLTLQRTAGNAAVAAMLRAGGGGARTLARGKRVRTPAASKQAFDDRLAALKQVRKPPKPKKRLHHARTRTGARARGAGTTPDAVRVLHVEIPARLDNYGAWLEPDNVWQQRSADMQLKRAHALRMIQKVRARLLKFQLMIPEGFRTYSRQDSLSFLRDYQPAVHRFRDAVMACLAEIDRDVTEPPPNPKSWPAFMGDATKPGDYHTGTAGDPIPIVFYKREADYAPITANGRTYHYPAGPQVTGRLGTYDLRVNAANRYAVGTVIYNSKQWGDEPATRTRQVDINVALRRAGASMVGLDGDHVRDLGFGGQDVADNYWPLVANVNRRPFLGWRALYGVNYKKSDGTLATAPITALGGKFFVIKALMGAADGNVPAEGALPATNSGTTN